MWCDECLHWNCHSLHEEDEEVAGLIIKRYPNCECRIGKLIYSMGMADGELAKMLQTYPIVPDDEHATASAQSGPRGPSGSRNRGSRNLPQCRP